ncbi:MAG: hypothetical protein LBB61_09920 [Treponema sp.]|nr:hypothetical protein [Treponema sp.]
MLDKTRVNDEVKSFIMGTFIKDYLKFGDTFHLISFNGTASVEISRRIMGNDDLNAISAALSLPHISAVSNPAGALAFAAAYIASLASTRSKKAVLITNAPNAQNIVSEARTRFSALHVPLEWINLPSAPHPPPVAPQTAPQAPVQTTPEQTMPEPPEQSVPAAPDVMQHQPKVIVPQAPDEVQSVTIQPPKQENDRQAAQKPTIITPDPQASQAVRIRPRTAFQIPRPSPVIVVIAPVIFLFMVLAVLFHFRYVLQSLDRTFSFICSQRAVEPAFLSLFVKDQNTNIGRRNMHTISAGYSLTLGGGNSDFLIFLVPLPQSIAAIRFDGNECVFIPQKRQFFPGLDGKALLNCTEKTIRIGSKRNYEIFIRIIRHEAPYKKLRSLFQSIKLPAQFARG